MATPPRICADLPASGNAREIVERFHPVLRRLRHDRIGHAVLRIEPEVGLVWIATGERDLQRGGDVLFADAQPARQERSTSTLSVGASKGCWMRASATPVTWAIRFSKLGGEARLAARSVPITCTSIGAGRPKFRICVTMSAGRKAKVAPGKLPRQFFAQASGPDRRPCLPGLPRG